MAISVRATSTGTSANTTTGTINLPAGTAVGDVTFIAYFQNPPNYFTAVATLTPPSGWTVLYNFGCAVVCYRAFQLGDPTTNITCTSTLTNWFESLAISYSGADTTSPIDSSAAHPIAANLTGVIPTLCRAPSLNPNFNASRLLCIFAEGGSASKAIALPSGLSAQVNTSVGPNLRLADKVLTDGTPTGTFDATVTSPSLTDIYFGMSIAVKAAGASAATLASAQPTVCGFYQGAQTSTSLAFVLDRIDVRNGDLVVIVINGPSTVSAAPAGYTAQSSQSGAIIYTHPWLTGDPTSLSFTLSTAAAINFAVAVIRQVGVGLGGVNFDQIAVSSTTATSNPSTTTTNLYPELSPSELLLLIFGSNTATAGTWSAVTGGVTDEVIQPGGPGLRFSWVAPAAVPTGTFSATWTAGSGSPALAAAAMLVSIGTVSRAVGSAAGSSTVAAISTGPAPYSPGSVPAGHAVNFNFLTSPYTPPLGHVVNFDFSPVAGATTGVGSAAGTGTASGVGNAIKKAVGAAAGTGTASGASTGLHHAVGSSAGTGTAAAVGIAGHTATATGTGTAHGVGKSTAVAAGTATGTGTAAAVGRAVKPAIGSATGTGTASAVGLALRQTVGSAAGTGTASAVGRGVTAGTGSAAGTSSAVGAGSSLKKTVGAAHGTGTATAVGQALKRAAGHAPGTSAAIAHAAIFHRAVGTAHGTGQAAATAFIVEPTVFFRSVF